MNVIIDTVYKKKHSIILADIRSGKSLLYQLISLIQKEAIVSIVLPTIILITN